MKNVVCVKNLKKYFDNNLAVDDISFDIKKGEILGFLGPNGAGKSTTIRCMMGFNKPTAGSVEILGQDMIDDAIKAKQDIGYLSGSIKLYDNWTGLDHIRFVKDARDRSDIVSDLIKRLDFNQNVKFRHLSSGNKQKLGLILALMHQPKVLIMDEPTVGLDPLLQSEIYKILLEMRDKGASILISSHNLPEIERLCDRVVIIRKGKLVAIENIKALSDKKLYKIEARFKNKVNLSKFKIDNVDELTQNLNTISMSVRGDINVVLAEILKYKLVDLRVEHASLEDTFMKFYKEEVE